LVNLRFQSVYFYDGPFKAFSGRGFYRNGYLAPCQNSFGHPGLIKTHLNGVKSVW